MTNEDYRTMLSNMYRQNPDDALIRAQYEEEFGGATPAPSAICIWCGIKFLYHGQQEIGKSQCQGLKVKFTEKLEAPDRLEAPIQAECRRIMGRGMNKLESEYEALLHVKLVTGRIDWYGFEPFKLRLADNCTYSPDFVVIDRTGALECHEVKGFWRDDARVKIKVAAEHFPFKFVAVTKRKVKDGGGWAFEEFASGLARRRGL